MRMRMSDKHCHAHFVCLGWHLYAHGLHVADYLCKYAAPTIFTEPGCKGQTTNNVTDKSMCPAAVAYELDFQDYVTFLTYGEPLLDMKMRCCFLEAFDQT